MNNNYKDYLIDIFNIDPKIIKLVDEAERNLLEEFHKIDEISYFNQLKILKAFQENQINSNDFNWNTGYGYDDKGRDAVEKVYSSVFKTEAALVRPNIVNGTHAISTTLLGLLERGDELIEASGAPYDTLKTVIGTENNSCGTLINSGIKYKEIPLNNYELDFEKIKQALSKDTKVVALQRSTGYDYRPAISLNSIEKACKIIHEYNKDIIVMIDNCYGEFVDTYEPTEIGVDVMAGSLIKNPGGGLALSGGYIVGRKDLIEKISYRLTCPGIGAECGLTYGQNRNVLQGLFLAPKVVNSALKGAILSSYVYKEIGFDVLPEYNSNRSDIIQAIKFKNSDIMIEFCKAIQFSAPIESYVEPVPWKMPGYKDEVIMASGSFVQGSSIELSADAPIRPPYIAYFQGGLTYEHAKYAIMNSLDILLKKKYITI